MVLGAPDIPCLMHDTRLCQLDVKMTNNYHGTKKIKYKTCQHVKNMYTQYIIREVKRPDYRSLELGDKLSTQHNMMYSMKYYDQWYQKLSLNQ